MGADQPPVTWVKNSTYGGHIRYSNKKHLKTAFPSTWSISPATDYLDT
jgi:hypothetical protein